MPDTRPTIRWLDWGETAFTRATHEDKPILLALVAPWCEYCAAMDRSTYSRAEVAGLIDARFIAVRVDTDRRPDINERYNLGGWPTTVFLTPDGEILGGSTFIDSDRMVAALDAVATAFVCRRAEIDARVAALHGQCEHHPGGGLPAPGSGAPASPDVERATPRDVGLPAPGGGAPGALTDPRATLRDPVDWLSSQLLDRFDPVHGGFGDGPQFPYVPALMLAFERYRDTGDPSFARVVTSSLDQLGRLHDEVEGGFFRYAACRDWRAPHTEKVLHDNAALIRLYLEAGTGLTRRDYLERAQRAIDWVHRTLAVQGKGGFAASQAADRAYYALDSLDARRSRAAPRVDPTLYVDSNAEMIAAYLRAADILDEDWLREFALRSLDQLVLTAYRPGAGIAHVAASQPDGWGMCADQVRAADALLLAHAATGQLPYSMLTAELMEYAVRTMWDGEDWGFCDAARERQEADFGLVRRSLRPLVVNCEAACVLSRLSIITGRSEYRERAERTLSSLDAVYRDDPLLGASYGLAIREVRDGRLPHGLSLSPVDWKLSETDDH